jgi:hypothetical protein
LKEAVPLPVPNSKMRRPRMLVGWAIRNRLSESRYVQRRCRSILVGVAANGPRPVTVNSTTASRTALKYASGSVKRLTVPDGTRNLQSRQPVMVAENRCSRPVKVAASDLSRLRTGPVPARLS